MSQLDAVLKRIDQLLVATDARDLGYAKVVEAHTGAVTLATAIYGAGSPQVQLLLDAAKRAAAAQQGDMGWKYLHLVLPAVQGAMSRRLLKFSGGVVTQFLMSSGFQRRVSETATA